MEKLRIHYEDGNLITNVDDIIKNIDNYSKQELIELLKDAKKATTISDSFKVLLSTINSRIEFMNDNDYEKGTNSKGRSLSMKPPKGYAPPQESQKAPTKGFSFFDDSDGLILPKALFFCAIVVTCSMYALLLMKI